MTGRNGAPTAGLMGLLRCWSVPANFSALTTPDRSTFHLVNGLRFFSFLWILAFHTVLAYALIYGKEQFFLLADSAPLLASWIWNADKSVDLFFIISGFLIGLILLKELDKSGDINLPRFYLRRYLRLTPIYAVVALLYWWGNGSNAHTLWANLLYVNNFLPMDETALRWTWTLAVEEQFYLLLPLLLLWLARRGAFWYWMTGLLALAFAIRAGVVAWFPDLYQQHMQTLLADPVISDIYYEKLYDNLPTRYGPFVVGVMTAWVYLHRKTTLADWMTAHPQLTRCLHASALGLILFFAFFPINQTSAGQPGGFLSFYMVTHHNLFAIAVGWFMLYVFLNPDKPGILVRLLSWRGWQPFSQLTYSMYLTHMLIVGLAVKNVYFNLDTFTTLEGNTLIVTALLGSFALSLLVSVMVGILCWLLVEKPFLNLRDRLSDTPPAPQASPAPA